MKKILSLTLSLLLILSSLLSLAGCFDKKPDQPQVVEPDNKVHIVVLAGQSGARGKALVDDLPEEYKEPNVDVDILADGLPMGELNNIPDINKSAYIDVLEPGYGDFPSEFGPEIGMGETLASAYPKFDAEYKTVIVKYTACGSTFTDHWYSSSLIEDSETKGYLNLDQAAVTDKGDETGPLTNNLYKLVDKAIAELTDLGYEPVIDGMAFVHGEQDAKFDENMEIYERALVYFIEDFRAYFGDEDMPVVITEALTNSAKHSASLRGIQYKVGLMNNTSFVDTSDLYTNTFEPWHFGAESNIILGNRIAAEILSFNDPREIKSIAEDVIDVPCGVNVDLPLYVKANFYNYYTGYVKALYYSSYDCNKLGEQEITFDVETSRGRITYTRKVNVRENIAYVDGKLTEYADAKKNMLLPSGLGYFYVIKGEEGLYIAAYIEDGEIWTDGENWHKGDMGQKGNNDDFIVYVTDGSAADRRTVCLSSANLMRVYNKGVSLNGSDVSLEYGNLLYNGKLNDYAYHVECVGALNGEGLGGEIDLEFYISYEDLGIENPDDIKLCFNYSNITLVSGVKTAQNNYFVKTDFGDGSEEHIESYFGIDELTK